MGNSKDATASAGRVVLHNCHGHHRWLNCGEQGGWRYFRCTMCGAPFAVKMR